MSYYPAQLGQDVLVDKILHGKTDGTFLDIGASYHEQFSNSFFFEKERNWKGLAVELNPVYAQGWMEHRPNSIFHLADAAAVNYQQILTDFKFPGCIDFLSIDIDPPLASWVVLQLVMQTSYTFNVIAFEVDYGGDIEFPERFSIRDPSRELLRSKGYIHMKEIYDRGKTWYHVDDIWVNQATYNEMGEGVC
jgi:hypothetical protein